MKITVAGNVNALLGIENMFQWLYTIIFSQSSKFFREFAVIEPVPTPKNIQSNTSHTRLIGTL